MQKKNRRILIIDDQEEIRNDFLTILSPPIRTDELRDREREIFGESTRWDRKPGGRYEVTAARQGKEGLELARAALADRAPFAVVFVDMRMPPGWDGARTAREIRALDPRVQIVIVTAHADKTLHQIVREVGSSRNLLYLRKPFAREEVAQLAEALTEMWNSSWEAIKEMEEMASFAEGYPGPMLRYDAAGQIIAANLKTREVLGARIGARLVDLLPGAADVDLHACIRDGTSASFELSIDDRDYRFDVKGIEALGIGNIYGRDITEEKKIELQLQMSQRMEAVGKLAGGIAHDFNNVLSVITMASDGIRLRAVEGQPVDSELDRIQSCVNKSARLTHQLLAFSRRKIIRPRVLKLNSIIEDVCHMISRTIGEDIELSTRLAPDLWLVKVDRAQIEQVVVNLVVNARDAMPGGGALSLETANMVARERRMTRHFDAEPGKYAVLEVVDTGSGMTAEVIERIFEPFFTTKGAGEGTGMGLATVYGIVKQAGGTIGVTSTPGEGTTFKVCLPTVDGAPDREAREQRATLRPGLGELILVVEDEDDIRELIDSTLSQHGYKVFVAKNAREAMDIFTRREAQDQCFDLLITDVIMPGVSGTALAEIARELYPETRILFMSGYVDSSVDGLGILSEEAFMEKPISSHSLLRTIQNVLRKPR